MTNAPSRCLACKVLRSEFNWRMRCGPARPSAGASSRASYGRRAPPVNANVLSAPLNAAPRAAVQQVPQREQHGGLAGLARRMKDEVALVANELADVVQVHPRQGRDAVVVRRNDGTAGVEEAHRVSIARSMIGSISTKQTIIEHGSSAAGRRRPSAAASSPPPPRRGRPHP